MSTPAEARQPAHRSSLERAVVRHPMAAFLILTFTFAWTVVGVAILAESVLGPLPARLVEAFNALASVVGLTGPAVLVTAATGGRAGVRDLLRRSFRWRVGVHWYLVALVGLLSITLLAALPILGIVPLVTLARNWPLLFTVFLPGVLVSFVLINLAEEICWTGFMQHTLQGRHGPLLASVMVAPAFALVHLPAFFVSGWINDERTPFSQFPDVLLQVGFLAVFAIFVRVLVTWLYNGSGRSVPIVALFHSAFNMTNGRTTTPRLLGLSETLAPLIPLLAVVVIAVVVTVVTRGRLAYRPEAAAVAVPPTLSPPLMHA